MRRFIWLHCLALCLLACNRAPPRPGDAGAGGPKIGSSSDRTAPVADAAAAVSGDDSEGWQVLFDDLEAPVLAAWGRGERTFFVGEQGLAIERDGDDWWRRDVPTSQSLWWVWGRAVDHVLAGGEGGTLLQFDGNRWRRLNVGLDPEETVWGIWGTADQTWVVGGRPRTNGPGFVLREDDGRWSRLQLPVDVPNLYKVWGRGREEVIIVGDDSSLFELADEVLVEVDLGSVGESPEPLFTVTGDASDTVLAVGGINQGIVVERLGGVFKEIPFATSGLNGVDVSAAGEVTVVGLFGVIRRREGGNWLEQDLAVQRHYHAVFSHDSTAYAVGGDLLSEGVARRGLIVALGDAVVRPSAIRARPNPGPSDAGAVLDGSMDAGRVEVEPLDDGGRSSSSRDAGPGERDASSSSDPMVDAAVTVPGVTEPGFDAATPVVVDASTTPDAAHSTLPGPSELCDQNQQCAAGLECWYVQGQGELRCVQLCEDALECAPGFGSGARCAPPGCQTTLTVCLRGDWNACL